MSMTLPKKLIKWFFAVVPILATAACSSQEKPEIVPDAKPREVLSSSGTISTAQALAIANSVMAGNKRVLK